MTARHATCARCHRPDRQVAKVMPDGPLCAACRAEAIRHRGRCSGCGAERLLPGTSATGERLCCRCAGIDENYTCRRCGTEWALRRGICEWCHLADVLDALMDGPVDLSALRAQLLDAPRPDRIVIWLSAEPPRKLLQALSTGAIPLTHEGLDGCFHRVSADHLRALLVAAGLLCPRDECLARFDRWVAERLVPIARSEPDLKLLQQFAVWRLRLHLVAQSEHQPVRDEQVTNATQSLRVAASLLAWLRARDRDLSTCTQSDLDEWFSAPPATRAQAAGFVRWAVATRRSPKLSIPKRRHKSAAVLDRAQRVEILRRLSNPATGRLEHRVAAMLVVLFGQPFTKIAALTVDDVVTHVETVEIRLGQGLAPVPSPFAPMLRQLLVSRSNLNTAANLTSSWLFPGRRAGSHLRPSTLRTKVMGMGIDILGARHAALRQLVLDCPPPVVADMLGYSYQAIERHAQQAGSPWSSYAALRARKASTTPARRTAT
ncbi:MAG: recombinase XerD [Actinomycetota bacterium]|nr:recombinase XerD [Actinomycetota bacterium]